MARALAMLVALLAASATIAVETPTPNEFHVFMTLAYGMPVMVSTSAGTWNVADGRIASLDAGDGE